MDGVRIVRARLRGATGVPDARARLASRLDVALRDLDPGEAIVCLREARAMVTQESLAQPGAHGASAWRPLADDLRARLALARRPWVEFVGPDAAAVRFADTAEWLACAALDLLAGRLDACWWWCSLPQPGAAGVIAAWQRHPRAVPAALAMLAARRGAVAFARRLAQPANTLRHALLHSFALSDVLTSHDHPAVRALVEALADCPGDAPEGLPDAVRALLWLALGLARAPSAVAVAPRPPAGWLAPPATSAPAAPAHAGPAARPASVRVLTEQRRPGGDAVTEPPAASAPLVPIRVRPGVGSVVASILAAANDPAPAPAAVRPRGAAPLSPVRRPSQAASAESDEAPAIVATAPGPLPAVPDPATVERVSAGAPQQRAETGKGIGAASATATVTEFGGVFYLLNLALSLGLYPDFTRPAECGLALHPWDFLSLLAGQLLGPAFALDPLSDWLATAAGRPADCPPGLWANPPAPDWTLPAPWLTPWQRQTRPWRCTRGAGRQALWHPEGFCVADLPVHRCHEPACWPGWVSPLRTALRRRPPPAAIAGWPAWCARLVPFVVARLGVATGLPAATVVSSVLPARAIVRRSAERVNVHMSLAALPVEVRLAGLDRDLGWLPAAGCSLHYHFDSEGGL